MTAATFYAGGDIAIVKCPAHGDRPHIFNADRQGWECSTCGTLTRPSKPVKVLRYEDDFVPPAAPVLPSLLMVRQADGSSLRFDIPLTGAVLTLRLGLPGAAEQVWGVEQLDRVEVVWPKGGSKR